MRTVYDIANDIGELAPTADGGRHEGGRRMNVWVAIVYGEDVIEGVYRDVETAEMVAKERHREDWPVYVMSMPVDVVPPEGRAPTNGIEGGSWYPAVQPRPEWAK